MAFLLLFETAPFQEFGDFGFPVVAPADVLFLGRRAETAKIIRLCPDAFFCTPFWYVCLLKAETSKRSLDSAVTSLCMLLPSNTWSTVAKLSDTSHPMSW